VLSAVAGIRSSPVPDLALTETEFQATVVDLLRALGYRSMHVRRTVGRGRRWTTATSVEGWPDLFAWRPGRAVAIELKTETGLVSAAQERVLAELNGAGVEARVARPSQWDELVAWLR
jgi:hypothetical protein